LIKAHRSENGKKKGCVSENSDGDTDRFSVNISQEERGAVGRALRRFDGGKEEKQKVEESNGLGTRESRSHNREERE